MKQPPVLAPWIDGQPIAGDGPELIVISPSTGQPIASVRAPSATQVDQAVQAAVTSQRDGRWHRLPVLERQRILMAVGEHLRQRDTFWAELIAHEMGMPLGAARFIEVPFAAATFDYYAGLIAQIHGRTVPIDVPGAPPEYLAYTLPQPVGVSALITPWNFPLLLPAWKLAAALAAGCSVVLKPAPEAPLTALALGPLLQEAGVPDGVVNILPGGDEIGRRLVQHHGIAKIAFTGETGSGRDVLQAAGLGIKRVSVELGGKSPLIVFDDFDLDRAVSQCLFGVFFNSGQVCQATSRILVQRSIYPAFVDRLVDRAQKLRVGDALDPATDIGPVIRDDHLARMHQLVLGAVADGAQVATGGTPMPRNGFFYPPTVVTDVRPHMTIAQEEIFGPVAAVIPFTDETDAVQLANASSYGLSAAILTHDVRRALTLARDIEAGTVWVNTVQVLSPTAPFGGVKLSGIGRELGWEGLQEYLESKTVIVDLNAEPMTYF
jgi:phenylacetaldehyde dehydrogenase